jgi:DNA-binding winged helix-turn-helix (wHTH) protein/tetratricopeptide (TPR) repeat protein
MGDEIVMNSINNVYAFDQFRIDPINRELTWNDEPIPLPPLAFNALLLFIENQGRLLTKNELMTSIWPDTVVDDTNLAVLISAVRKAIGDSGQAQKYIVTVAKSGYRFIGNLHKAPSLEIEDTSPSTVALEKPLDYRTSWSNRRQFLLLSFLLMIVVAVCIHLILPEGTQTFQLVAHATPNQPGPDDSARSGGSAAIISSNDMGVQSSTSRAWYLKGRYSLIRGTRTGLQRSIAYFTNALAEDPHNALAYAGLADAYGVLATWSVQSSSLANEKAREAARRAVELDDSLSQAHSALGTVAMIHDWNFPVAEREFRRAIGLGPNDAIAHQRLAKYLAVTGKFPEAVREARLARDLDPLSLDVSNTVGRIFYCARQYSDAIAEFRKVIELDPNYTQAHYDLSEVYVAQRDFDDATAELRETLRLNGNRDPLALGLYGMARAHSGDQSGAEEILNELVDRSHREYVSPVSMAILYLGLDRESEALIWIDRIFDGHMGLAVWAGVDPLFDPIRSNPRFIAQLRRVDITRTALRPSPGLRQTVKTLLTDLTRPVF